MEQTPDDMTKIIRVKEIRDMMLSNSEDVVLSHQKFHSENRMSSHDKGIIIKLLI